MLDKDVLIFGSENEGNVLTNERKLLNLLC